MEEVVTMDLLQSITTINRFHHHLHIVKVRLYEACGFELDSPVIHAESREYAACSFTLNSIAIEHRLSKSTPSKNGQFVTTWKRNSRGTTRPFVLSDPFDFLIITAATNRHLGQFIFPKAVLADRGIVSTTGKEGKRGIRVYPPWDTANSKQAEKTQEWQTTYFIDVPQHAIQDTNRAKQLLELNPMDEIPSSGAR